MGTGTTQTANRVARAPDYERVDRVLANRRELHPELRRRLTWNGLAAVIRRERIQVVYVPMNRPAALFCRCGVSVLMLNSDLPPRRHTYYAAHELGHHWLHADEDLDPVYHMDVIWPDDPREDEAEYFAACLLGGPRWF